jgi:tetratricopeptide (TPR) repeat protein
VKQNLLFILCAVLSGLFFTSCATFLPSHPENKVYTMKTDMYPQGISRAEYYEQMAISYSLEGQSEKAIEYFRLSLLHNPARVSAYMNLSDEYRKTDRNHLAIVELSEALNLEPNNLDVMKKMGDLYLSTHIYSKAREVYQEMLNRDHKFEEAKWALFYIYKMEQKYNEALKTLALVQVNDETGYRVAYEKALIYKLKKSNDNYLQNLNLAYSLNPRDRDVVLEYSDNAFSNKQYKTATRALLDFSNTHEFDIEISQDLAFAAVQAEQYDIALREYNKQRPLATDVAAVDLKKGHVYYLMQDLVNAEKSYLQVLKYDDNDEARFYLAQIYIAENKSDDAALILSRLQPSSDYYGEARMRLALYQKNQGEADDAINTIREAYIKRPDQLIIYKTYADFLIESKRYVETVALLEKGITLFPRDEELRLKMAFLHYRLHNQKSFKKQIFAALKINPESAATYAMLSELWYLKNKPVDEIYYFVQKATELKSNNKNIKPLLAWVLMQQNNSTEAVALFEEFYEENPNESFFARSLSQVYSRGDVQSKAKELAEAAAALESNDSLRSRFMFKEQTETVNSENYRINPARLPASLENK